jgi:DNA-binding response OmpR family regulator
MSNIGEEDRPHPCERAIALVVDNDPWTRLVMRDLLAQVGYGVLQASNGFSALRLALHERLALVLLDLVLPERSGISVLAELRAAPATAYVPVIVVSGQPHLLRDAVIQADAVIAKPFATDTFLAEVARSRQRAINRMRFTTSASGLATRPGEVEASAVGRACAGRPCVGAAHLLRSTRESPANGDGFSPGCGRLLVRQREVEI